MNDEKNVLPTSWQKWESFAKILSLLLVPLLLAILGAQFNKALKQEEVSLAYVKTAIDILKEPPTEDRKGLREWAKKVLNRYSDVPLSSEAEADLDNVPLFSQKVAEFLTDTLRAWIASDRDKNRAALNAWLKAKGIDTGDVLFLLQDEYAEERQEFLREMNVIK